MTSPFGLTPQGFKIKRLPDIHAENQNLLLAAFGEINLDPQSIFGQLIGVISKVQADLWENLQDVYFSQYPNSAEGISLDNVVQINAIQRLAAKQTKVTAVCTGLEGTLINQGALARIPDTGSVFFCQANSFITRSNASSTIVLVGSAAPQAYTTIINNLAITYSLPVITFTGSFVTGNSIVVTLNGTTLPAVPFNTNNNQTLADLATAIANNPNVFSATPIIPNIISIVPSLGSNVTINSIVITGGASQPTYAIAFAQPTASAISQNLSSIINNSISSVTATDLAASVSIVANDPDIPFSINVGTNLSISSQSSPITFLSQDFAPIAAPINTLTEILTPISGWNSINNPKAGVTGRLIETDTELRIRRNNSIRLLGVGTVESIRARLLQQVPYVTSAYIFENRTMTQDLIDIVLNQDLVPGNTITIVFNTIQTLPVVTFATSHLDTMEAIAIVLANQPQIASAVVGGVANRTITLSMKEAAEIEITTFSVSGGASQAMAVLKGGRLAKSFEAVIEGGSDADVANKIWTTKPAGIQTFGNTSFTITDSQGEQQIINFSRPTPIYIWVAVALTLYPEETFPPNGQDLVADAINSYGNSLGIGVDVLLQRVLAQIFTVSGIASGVMQIAATNGPGDSPLYGTADIPIQENEIAVFDLSRITVTV